MMRLLSRIGVMLRTGGGVWDALKLVFDALFIMRGAVLVALLGALALSLPEQTIEIYRVLALDAGEVEGGGRAGMALATLLLASLALWYVARHATGDRLEERQRCGDRVSSATLRWAPRATGVALPAGAALGLHLGRPELMASRSDYDLDRLDTMLLAGIGLCLLIAIGVVLFTIYRHHLPWPAGISARNATQAAPLVGGAGRVRRRRGLLSHKANAAILLLALACMLANWRWPVEVPQGFGALPPFFLFIVLLVVGLSAMLAFDDRHKVPLTLIAIGLGVLFSYRDWGNHHALSFMPRAAELPKLDEAFRQWYAARLDREAYERRGEPYPVFVVAAPGGGLYAAQFTATVLARLQDTCPRFAHHTFAISGVSGGALGAAVFSSLARRTSPQAIAADRCDLQPKAQPRSFSPGAGATLEAAVSEFMARDFMAPVSTAALFLDLPQRMIPYPLLPFNRAGAQERAFALAWDDVAAPAERLVPRGNVFDAPFLSHWDPKGTAPALMLNATEVSRGHRVVMAPFELGQGRGDAMLMRRLLSFHKLLGESEPDLAPGDIPLATAVGISARFPWLMPAAPLGPLRLVDGAVFENSGVETAMDLVAELRRYDVDLGREEGAGAARGAPRIRLTLIVIHNFDDYQPKDGRTPSWFMAPVQALLSARAARASFAVSRADDVLCGERGGSCVTSEEPHKARAGRPLVPIYLDHVESAFALGWHLSRATRRRIADQASEHGACRMEARPPAPAGEQSMHESVPIHNGCSACFILSRLAPDPRAALARCGLPARKESVSSGGPVQ